MVQCGLANKFSPTRWKEIYIRRGKDINQSLLAVLNQELGRDKSNYQRNPVVCLREIQAKIFTPIYLIFDQFEELFIVDSLEFEQRQFFSFMDRLMSSDILCKVILIMREEFIAKLWPFEKELPFLFDYRYRVEKMRDAKLEIVIKNTLTALADSGKIAVDQPELVANQIVERLNESKAGNELTYLQVFLDRMFRSASKREDQFVKGAPSFTVALVNELGKVEDVIDDFLGDQLQQLERQLGEGRQGIPLKILSELITEEKTKKVLQDEELEALRLKYIQEHGLTEEEWEHCMRTFESMRIIRRFEED